MSHLISIDEGESATTMGHKQSSFDGQHPSESLWTHQKQWTDDSAEGPLDDAFLRPPVGHLLWVISISQWVIMQKEELQNRNVLRKEDNLLTKSSILGSWETGDYVWFQGGGEYPSFTNVKGKKINQSEQRALLVWGP